VPDVDFALETSGRLCLQRYLSPPACSFARLSLTAALFQQKLSRRFIVQ